MTNAQFTQAVRLAAEIDQDEFDHDILSQFVGCGLKSFGSIWVSLREVAEFIRYQASYIFHEGFDQDALREIKEIGRRKFLIID